MTEPLTKGNTYPTIHRAAPVIPLFTMLHSFLPPKRNCVQHSYEGIRWLPNSIKVLCYES